MINAPHKMTRLATDKIDMLARHGMCIVEVLMRDEKGSRASVDAYGKVTWEVKKTEEKASDE